MVIRRKWIYQAMRLAEKQVYIAEKKRLWTLGKAWGQARYEHAFLLRCEGLKLREIGDRLGVSKERVRSMLYREARKLSWAMRRTRVYFDA